MDHMSYNRVRRRSSRRCFRLNLRRFSVQRLRIKFLYFFRLFSRWRSLLQSLKKGAGRDSCRGSNESSSRRNLVTRIESRGDYRLRSFGRSNSFYSEAIADCLEFIKRSSVSLDEYKSIEQI